MEKNWPIQKIGSQGENVRTVQYLLRHHGFHLGVDRKFGRQTQDTVRDFQRDQGLQVDGIVGNETWPALIVLVSSGGRGDVVRAVQRQLNARSSSLAIDGVFGPQTALAIRRFQQANGLLVDGIVGPDTWYALVTAPAAGPTLRRNIAKVSEAERNKLRDAILQLDIRTYPDGVSFWDKQDQIHQATHVHGGPSFIPWHRELINRFEALLRQIDPTVALHYWDWQTDPRSSPGGAGGTVNLFSTGPGGFMGSASGRAGPPLDGFDNGGSFPGSRDATGNPADPPREIRRNLGPGAPALDADATLLAAGDGLPGAEQWQRVREAIEDAHNTAHGYFGPGSSILNAHRSFEDPFVFLLHSNVDRLWAKWQREPGQEWRLDPARVYGDEGTDPRILENLEPWAGGTGTRPWAPPDNQQQVKNCKHPSVVEPPRYED
ncbi:peptidoglycan-binding protein [Pseudonocardia sp. DSM 110487]|uniref:peptidoglycan-binding protein n=1 Tax=Pseudonocardia sp. DSM 110487 TaxID=2865833 RepID=UPI001C699738|nr:peptidoglycan-binding protein [Pseudonocardia sp. DSM 110487]QYN33661.1 peptidoglycan-binding protein [Pseudonocardia sp. DSM 110487]